MIHVGNKVKKCVNYIILYGNSVTLIMLLILNFVTPIFNGVTILEKDLNKK